MTDLAHGAFHRARSKAAVSAAVRDWRCLVALLVLASAVLHFAWPLPEDPSWLLTVCERMLAGRALYADIAELNPPMSAWLYMPVVWLAPKLGVSPDLLLVPVTIAICLAAIAIAERILTSAGLLKHAGPWWFAAAFALLVVPVLGFAQREHFAVAFALPMLAALAARASGRRVAFWMAVCAGLLGGLTMSIKPHFAAAIVAPALYAAFARRSFRPMVVAECVVSSGIVALYVAAALWLHPEYLSEMLPMAAAIYVPNRAPLDFLLTRPFAMMVWLCLVAWFMQKGFREQPLSRVLLAATLGFLAAYLVQGRGWTYHLLPAATLATIGFGIAAFGSHGASRTNGERRMAVGSAALAAGLLLAMTCSNVLERERDELPFIRGLAETLKPLGDQLKVAVLSDEVAIGSPLHREIGATLVNRGPSLWMTGNALAHCQKDRSPQARQTCDRVVARERAMLREDLRREPPDVVIVGTDREWLAWARRDPETASMLDGYQRYASVEHGAFKVDVLVRAAKAAALSGVPGT